MDVIKRNGGREKFDLSKIEVAIGKSLGESEESIEWSVYCDMIDSIKSNIVDGQKIEDIQDSIEVHLMTFKLPITAKKYILYRKKRDEDRINEDSEKYGILTKEFLSKYKHVKPPMTQLGELVYYRTYSRFLDDKNRREYWWETVRRAVEYNCSLIPTSKSEAESLYDNIFNLRQFLSGRTFWVGNTPVSSKFPMSNFNCAFDAIDSYQSFSDLFYLLMIGSGIGVRVIKKDIIKMPRIRTNVEVVHEAYIPVQPQARLQKTELRFFSDTAKIIVGDSKEGWVSALNFFFQLKTSSEYCDIREIRMCYNSIRPKGEKLSTFGGTASGYAALMNIFAKIDLVIKKYHLEEKHKLLPIDCLDIANIIGEGVVVGGVRRTAEIVLVDQDDKESISAKDNLYVNVDGNWIVNNNIVHRQMSNNSIYYKTKPTREMLHWQINKMRYSGEPGWVNEEAGKKRRENFNGVNPLTI